MCSLSTWPIKRCIVLSIGMHVLTMVLNLVFLQFRSYLCTRSMSNFFLYIYFELLTHCPKLCGGLRARKLVLPNHIMYMCILSPEFKWLFLVQMLLLSVCYMYIWGNSCLPASKEGRTLVFLLVCLSVWWNCVAIFLRNYTFDFWF